MLRRFKLKEGWSSFFILALMVLCAFWSVSSGGLADGLGIVSWAVVAGLFAGLGLAKSRIHGLLAHVLALGFGAVWVVLLASSLLPSEPGWAERLAELQLRLGAWSDQVTTGAVSTDQFMFSLGVIALGYVASYVAAWSVFRAHWVGGPFFPPGGCSCSMSTTRLPAS